MSFYLGFAALYNAQAFDIGLSVWQEIGLLFVALITSKGSAGVAGSGFIILTATLSTTGVVPVEGIKLIFRVDRFMSTVRGLVSLCAQMLASIVVSKWEGVFDPDQVEVILAGPESTTAEEKILA